MLCWQDHILPVPYSCAIRNANPIRLVNIESILPLTLYHMCNVSNDCD